MTIEQSRRTVAHSVEWEKRISVWESELPERMALCNLVAQLKLVVTEDLDQCRRVFPEFTPHNVRLHAERMIRMADSILGMNLSQLSEVEYLILLTAIYAHDWGMTVSPDEKALILRDISNRTNTVDPARSQESQMALLPDETEQLLSHLRQNNVEVPLDCSDLSIGSETWSEYVRITHGERSGERVRAFFRGVHRRFGNYAALVAEGHAATEERIADRSVYMIEAAGVFDDDSTVNLQALAVYVRLIDLFDLSDERTPYSLWRVVNPRTRTSVIEWQKHLSLAPVHLNTQAGSLIFQGTVRDAETWAAVNDLKSYCHHQFEFSQSLLSKYSDKKYHLAFHWLDWDNVRPEGICSEVVRFGFDRNAVFAILSEEVYDRDPYVFIRELLQNAIDAVADSHRM